jgi:hypothetical protein
MDRFTYNYLSINGERFNRLGYVNDTGTDYASYDDIKGEGNSINYKYRMHDPRVGRFFAVDPLAPKYPHNSPYAFSENSTIAFIELEGLERYYAADGELLGVLNISSEIRVLTDEKVVELARQVLTGKEDQKSNRLMYLLAGKGNDSFSKFYNSSDKADLKIASNILTSMYNQVSDVPLADGYIRIVNSHSGSVEYGDLPMEDIFFLSKNAHGNHINKKLFFGINFPNEKGLGSGRIAMNQIYMENHFYDMAMVLYHESLHTNGYDETAWGEFNAHYYTAQHSLYEMASEGYQQQNLTSLGGYLEQQRKQVEENPNNQKLKKQYDVNKRRYEKEVKRYIERFGESE